MVPKDEETLLCEHEVLVVNLEEEDGKPHTFKVGHLCWTQTAVGVQDRVHFATKAADIGERGGWAAFITSGGSSVCGGHQEVEGWKPQVRDGGPGGMTFLRRN